MNFKIIIGVFSLIFATSYTLPEARFCELTIVKKDGQTVILKVEVARNDYDRQLGLMYRRSLPENQGMLFVFENEEYLDFWMKNTYIPLDIAYISGRGIVNEIQGMKPLDISLTYPSKLPAKYALEVNAGWFRKKHISVGSAVIFDGCLSK